MTFVIDINIWISAGISNRFWHLINAIDRKNIKFYVCQEFQNELISVCNYERIKKYISPEKSLFMIQAIMERGVYISVEVENVFKDPKDNYLLAMCKKEKVNYLVTGDKPLLNLVTYEDTLIISNNEFLNQLV